LDARNPVAREKRCHVGQVLRQRAQQLLRFVAR
jgi:hypothetical protein